MIVFLVNRYVKSVWKKLYFTAIFLLMFNGLFILTSVSKLMFKPGAYLLPLSGIVMMNIKVYICSLFHGFIYGMISISGVYLKVLLNGLTILNIIFRLR